VDGIPSVVLLRPSGDGEAAPPSEPIVVDQLGLAFLPTQVLVRRGQTIRFVNSETLAHNVHVTSVADGSTVYMADMDPDDHRETTLDTEGAYDVTCDVHPGMRALVYVTSAPYAAFAEPDGSFSLPDVPPGSYVAQVWSASPGMRGERPIEVSGPSTELDLTANP
jgi:plastocyanin